jgi:esterase/lipase superfamily enzyme
MVDIVTRVRGRRGDFRMKFDGGSRAYRRAAMYGVLGFSAIFASCSGGMHPYSMEMMPPPSIYETGVISSPDERHPELRDGLVQLPYATPRQPAGTDDDASFYRNMRGSVLRLGIAAVRATPEERHSSDQGKTAVHHVPLMLEVTDTQERGVLPATQVPFAAPEFELRAAETGPTAFATEVNRLLMDGSGRDIYIYVHGYKVVFENAVAVSTELWHYLDYEGAFVAFAWPSTPRRMAYLGDLETAEVSAIFFRRFLAYLLAETQARRVHIVAYSAGTRVVTSALAGLALSPSSATALSERGRIGQVVLIGSDMDRALMALQISDGILELVDGFTVYVSAKDKALDLSRRLYGRDRAGAAFAPGQPPPVARAWLDEHPKLSLIDVTDAAESTIENGHRYFRKSPWVSSDMLMMLRFGLGPDARGLVRSADSSMWQFPADYLERLSAAVAATVPANGRSQPEEPGS